MSHFYLMNYTLQFTKNYLNSSQWIYNHFTAAHEASGQHAQTLDKDLKTFIKHYIETYENSHEIVVILNGDHGMRYGGFMTEPESIQEFRLPALFIIAKHEFLQSFEGEKPLIHNSFRLTTKTDLRQTMLFLSDYQNNLAYKNENNKSFNLFKNFIPDSRSCKDAEIPYWFCSSFLPMPVEIFDKYNNFTEDQKEISRLFMSLQEKVLDEINFLGFASVYANPGRLCVRLTKGKIEEASIVFITKKEIIVRMKFAVFESFYAKFHS